jgi:uncharacterized damage-inducible protein DinB
MHFYSELRQQSWAIFSALSDEDLKRRCRTPANAEFEIWKWLRAMVEHEIHHRAELYLYLNMLDVKTPPIFGLTAEELIEKSRNS